MRKLLVAVVVLLVLVGAVAFAASKLNTYLQDNREWLAGQVSAALGRPVSFDEIGVSFRGGLGARVTDLSIGDDAAFSKDQFLQVARADVVVKILPALRGSYEVKRVVLDAPTVNVIRGKSGFNFESIGKAGDRPAAESTAPPEPEAEAGGSEAIPLLVSLMEIRDGRLSFVDRTTSPATEMVVEQLDFSASDVGFDSPMSIDLAMAVLGSDRQNISVDGTVGPLGSPQAAAQAPINLDVQVGPVVIDRLKKLPMVGESIPLELSCPDPISVSVDVSGKADAPSVVVSLDATDAGLRYGSVFDKPAGTTLSMQADVAQSGDRIDISSLVLRLAEAKFNGSGSVGTGPGAAIDFRLKGAGVPLAGWGRVFSAAKDIDVGGSLDLDVGAKGSAAAGIPALNGTVGLAGVRAVQPGGGIEISDLTTQLALKGDRVELPKTQLKVGGQPVTVAATVTSLKDLSAEVSIAAAKLPLAAVGAAGEGVKREEVVEGLQVEATVHSAAAGPRARASVRSSAGSLRDVAYQQLDVEVGVADERASLKQLSVKAFDGLVTGAGSVDMAKANAFAFRGRLVGLDVAAIVDYLGAASALRMTGKVNGDIALDGSGSDQQAILQNLTGDGSLQVADGVLKGVNLAEEVLRSVTGVPGLSQLIGPKTRQKYPSLFSESDTVFEALGGKMNIAGAVVNLKDLELAARDYRLSGAGTVGFDKQVDIGTTFTASQALTGDLLGSVKEVKYLLDGSARFALPVRLVGVLPEVRVRPDTSFIAQKLSGALVSEGLDKGLDALFGKKKGEKAASSPEPQSGEPAPKQPAKPEDAGREMLRKGLEGLLGGGR